MNRREYKRINSILRDNGSYALKWLSPQQLAIWDRLTTIQNSVDPLAYRECVVQYYLHEKLEYNFRDIK